MGRFISEDSVNDPNNPNEFVYVANNPIVNIDPTGHSLGNVINAVGKVSQALNLAAELNPDLKGVASAFSKFAGALSNVRDFVMGAQQVFGQKNIKVTKDKVIVKTADGGEKIYDKKKMKTEFQQLAEIQADKTQTADAKSEAATKVKDNYKDYFEAVKGDNTGVTVIGLRGWGIGTPVPGTDTIKGEHPYDDMLLVLDENGNLGAFSEVNFEGSSAKGYYYKKNGKRKNLDGDNPSIQDGNYTINAVVHSGYDALSVNNNGNVPINETINSNYPDQIDSNGVAFANFVHIHKGGTQGWNYSEGCITVIETSWNRFWSYFDSGLPQRTEVGRFSLMTL